MSGGTSVRYLSLVCQTGSNYKNNTLSGSTNCCCDTVGGISRTGTAYSAGVKKNIMNRYGLKASMTVEAALAFPVFFFALMTLCYIFVFLGAQYTIHESMLGAVRLIGPYGDIVALAVEGADSVTQEAVSKVSDKVSDSGDIGQVLAQLAETKGAETLTGMRDALVIRSLLEIELSKHRGLMNVIDGGAAGISCFGSELYTEDECIEVTCNYTFSPPLPIFGLLKVQDSQSLKYRYYTGYKVESLLEPVGKDTADPEEEDTIVYVTDTGKVYHTSLMCPNLKIVIRTVAADTVGAERNDAGGKYYPCEKCAKGSSPGVYYITSDGDRYHYDIGCSGLKRSIREVRLSDVEGKMRACRRCPHTAE